MSLNSFFKANLINLWLLFFCTKSSWKSLQLKKSGIQERERKAGNAENCHYDSGKSPKRFLGMLLIWHSGECWKRFRVMVKKIPGNGQEDARKCLRRFRGMVKNISGNLNLVLFREIFLIFYQILPFCNSAILNKAIW